MAETNGRTDPRRPVMTVQVGVTGHRALPDGAPVAVATAAEAMFRATATAARRMHAADQASADPVFAGDAPILRCLSGLAIGADTILAAAALDAGWTLVAVLPFARAEFERDFDPADLPRLQTLIARSAIVSELDGDRGRGGEPYAEIGRQIVEQSDLLLAVWDGLPPRGPGGTGDVVQQALDRTLPVAVLPPDGTALAWQNTPNGTGIEAILAAAILPPPDPGGFPQALYRETLDFRTWAATTVRWFEQAVLLGVPRPAPGPAPSLAGSLTPAPPEPVTGPERHVDAVFAVVDAIATHYAARFRAAGLLRYGLVLPATLGSFIGNFAPGWAKPFGYVLQFATLMAVLGFSRRGHWSRDQARFIAYRAVAEYLRNARLLIPLGATLTPPRVPVHQEPVADWATWYGRTVLRQAGLAGGHGDPAAVATARDGLRAAAEGEIAFLRSRVVRFAAIARRLRRIGTGLTFCGFGLVAVHAGIVYAGAGPEATGWFNELSLVIPALAPVFLGLLGFGEYGRLSTRYAAVAAELEGTLVALDRAGPERRAVLPIARRITEIMLAEGADWQLLIKARTLSV